MDKKGIENFTLAQLSKLTKRNNPTGLDDDFIILDFYRFDLTD